MDDHRLNRDFPGGSDEELALLYQLGIALASGKDLFSTLLTLQTTILKLIQADAMFVAIYDETTDIVEYPIYFEVGQPERQPSRRLSERPGLTGAVIYPGKTLYLPEVNTDEIFNIYSPVDDNYPDALHTFLGIPLIVNYKVIGVLSVQSTLVDAYSADQIQLMENVAIQAALAIDKSRLLDSFKKELEERTKAETDLRQRESILEAVTFAAEEFLKSSDWRLNIDHVLERLGTTMHVTHAYLFQDHVNAQGEDVTSMRHEWTAPGYPGDLDSPWFQGSIINSHGYEDQAEALRRGDVRAGNSSSFNPIEKEAMEELGIKAILEVPIFVSHKEWGAIGFDDSEQERQWTSAEVDALKIAAGILGAAIQRQKADAAVQESERIYRQAIEAADAVPYYYDYASNSYVFIGEGIRTMTGYGPEEMTPALWSRIIEETINPGYAEELNDGQVKNAGHKNENKAWKRDQKIRTRDGRIRWLTDRSVQLSNDRKISYGSIGIMQDITERKLVEANLQKGEAILEVVAEAANTFLKISEWNADVLQREVDNLLERLGTTITASHAYLFENDFEDDRVFMTMRYEWTAPGYESDLGNPKYIKKVASGDPLKRWDKIIQQGLPFIGDWKHLDSGEMDELHRNNIQALVDVPIIIDGRWWGTIGFDDMEHPRTWSTTEVDALVVAANLLVAAIKRNQMDLILQKELGKRKALIEELESKNEELERFTYTVSHDLKSPLVTISGFLGYLEQDALGGNMERFRQDAQRIQEAVAKMQRLLLELLELSRIGRMMNPPQEVSLNDLIKEAIDIVHGCLEEHNVTVHIQPDLATVYGDKPRLIEVLQNLIDNAAKYMGNQPDPRVEIGQRGEDGGKPIFYIQDNGIGIARQHYEQIFGLFNKLDATSEGTGVGLALVKRIIEVHGGRIWVESKIGKGSTFYFTLAPSG